MKNKSRGRVLFLAAFTILLLTASVSKAQCDSAPKKRLRSPATVRGFVGGESQDIYVIRAHKGRTMTIRISWRLEEENTADFSVSSTSESENEEQIVAGTYSDNEKRWSGRIPKTGDYTIFVVASPSAHYRLSVRVR